MRRHVFAFRVFLIALAISTASCADDPAAPEINDDPNAVQIVYEDIPRFWLAFDRITSATDTIPLRVDYLNRATPGLRDFTAARWRTSSTLTGMVWPLRSYYQSIRQNTLSVAALEPEIRAALRAFDALYPDAVFPNVYFTIGGLSTGGTTSPSGLLIGTEMYSRAPSSPVGELNLWQRSVVRTSQVLPAIVVHELIHYQQKLPGNVRTLLGESIREGSADFLSELLTGRTINEHLNAYATGREQEIWEDFERAMNGVDISEWLYNGSIATDDRPADLGYYVGAQITKAYYDRAADKKQAIKDILTITDFNAFLIQSGYGNQFD
jgi:hypothetical protein